MPQINLNYTSNFLTNKLGLKDSEVLIYNKLLNAGPCSITSLADELNLNRVTTYEYIENLLKKGIIAQTKHGSRRVLFAEPVEKLQLLIEQKKMDLEIKKHSLAGVIKQINSLNADQHKDSGPKISFFKGKENVRKIYDQVLNSSEFRSFFDYRQVLTNFPENMDLFVSTHKRRHDWKIWEITTYYPEVNKYIDGIDLNRYNIKVIPGNIGNIDYLIFDDKVAIVSLQEEITATLIESPIYFEHAKVIFELVWSLI